ncbi:Triose-phosphate Transporter [Irineochytrium annulatum]|nr:Triose-phosphate Transporter [Irineochytrium annulatum]
MADSQYPTVTLVGRKETTKEVLDADLQKQHGISLTTLITNSDEHRGPCLLCIRDDEGVVFGAFLSEPIHRQNEGFYGNGSCFLWTNGGGDEVMRFSASGDNEFFMTYIVSPPGFAMGGGDGKFGLFLDDSFEKGESAPCGTYMNPKLSAKSRYLLSAVLSVYNKNMMAKDRYNFNFPFFISMLHSFLQFAISSIIMKIRTAGKTTTPRAPPPKGLFDNLGVILPTAVCTALALSIASLQHISLSLYTIIKSTVPLHVLLFSFLLRLDRPTPLTYLTIFLIVSGVCLTVMGEIKFSWLGFALVQGASMSAGMRWCLTQVMMSKGRGEIVGKDPVETMWRLSPVMAVLLAGGSVVFEWEGVAEAMVEGGVERAAWTVGVIALGGALALLMTLAQFYLVAKTGVLAMSVAGIFKGIFQIIVSTIFFGDTLSPLGIVGVLVSTGGLGMYTWIKSRPFVPKKKKE